jgi:hypothetical protein
VDLAFIHARLATAMVLFAAIAGIWGLVDYFRGRAVSPSYWGVIVVGNLAAVAQAAIGAILYAQGSGEALSRGVVHILYGIVLALWIPLIQFFNRNREGRDETLMCGLVSLFEAGIALRAITTAGS